MHHQFIDFLKTGKLPSINIGGSYQEVICSLGEPTGFTRAFRKRRFPRAVWYGDLEIGFDENEVINYIQVDLHKYMALSGEGYFPLEAWPLTYGMQLSEVIELLKSAMVSFEDYLDEINPEIDAVITEGGVIFNCIKPGVEYMGFGLVNVIVHSQAGIKA